MNCQLVWSQAPQYGAHYHKIVRGIILVYSLSICMHFSFLGAKDGTACSTTIIVYACMHVYENFEISMAIYCQVYAPETEKATVG